MLSIFVVLKEETFAEVDKKKLLNTSRKGGVEPAHKICIKHFFGKVALINKDGIPLTALSFMAGNCVSKFNLKSVEVRIVLHFFHALAFAAYMSIVLQNGLVKFE